MGAAGVTMTNGGTMTNGETTIDGETMINVAAVPASAEAQASAEVRANAAGNGITATTTVGGPVPGTSGGVVVADGNPAPPLAGLRVGRR